MEGYFIIETKPREWQQIIAGLLAARERLVGFRAPIPPSFADVASGLHETAYVGAEAPGPRV